MWVHVPAGASDGPGAPPKLEQRTISYVPGLFKIFDEILVNAADNKQRDATMTCLRVDIDAAAGSVRVYNDGAGIPVELHKVEGVYVPELIFGHLLTSSNYDDTEKKARGARAACAAHPRAPAPYRARQPQACAVMRRPQRSRPPLPCAGGWRTQRLRRKAGQHLLHRVCGGDLRRQARPPLPPGLPRQHERQGRARHHALQAHRQLDVHHVQAGPRQVWNGARPAAPNALRAAQAGADACSLRAALDRARWRRTRAR